MVAWLVLVILNLGDVGVLVIFARSLTQPVHHLLDRLTVRLPYYTQFARAVGSVNQRRAPALGELIKVRYYAAPARVSSIVIYLRVPAARTHR